MDFLKGAACQKLGVDCKGGVRSCKSDSSFVRSLMSGGIQAETQEKGSTLWKKGKDERVLTKCETVKKKVVALWLSKRKKLQHRWIEDENLEPRWEEMVEIKEVFWDEFELSYKIFLQRDVKKGKERENLSSVLLKVKYASKFL